VSKIIVGVDESDRSKDAVALAALLARGTGAELQLVCAYAYDDVPSRGANAAYRHYLREDAEAAIERAMDGIDDLPQVRSRPIPELSPAKGIQDIATKEGASLIVIGSSGRGGAGRVFAGTTAQRLLHGAPCPVAVAPRGFHSDVPADIATIAVGYNGSVEAKAALVGARTIARVRGARLRLVEVLDATWLGTPALMQGPGFIMTPDDLEARARNYLTEAAESLAPDIPTEPVVAVGAPEQVLADESHKADLVVVGSRGYGPLRAVLLGSVSGRLVREAACPVIVVPRAIEAPLEELFGATSGTHAV
jgi:nucleotide-binding universal stress UspA family protein